MDDTPIEQLIQTGQNELLLAKIKADPSLADGQTSQGISFLLWSGYCQNQDAMKIIARFKKQFNIYEAAAAGKTDQLTDVLTRGLVAINLPSPDGFSALGFAAFFGQLEAVKILIANHADVNQPSANDFKVTPLHSACAISNYDIAKYLLEHGANVNAKQQSGVTPLHSAAHNGQLEIISLLVNFGADINAKMENGKTPLQMAKEDGHDKIVAYLSEQIKNQG